jgi:hypothetical protein
VGKHIILIRQTSALREISEGEALAALSDSEKLLQPKQFGVPTAQFADAIAQGDWAGQDSYLREEAAKVRALADTLGDTDIHYVGLAEVPHIIALGAHLGSERRVATHDLLGDAGPWRWLETAQTVKLKTLGADDLKVHIKAPGPVAIRISITSTVTDEDVRAAVGEGLIADITITHAEAVPTRHLIRSLADVEAVRKEFVAAYGAVISARPGCETIHLFVAAPPSIAFVVGQELVLRNGKPVQTYRYRASDGTMPSQQPALLLTASESGIGNKPLSEDEVKIAEHVRSTVWPNVLKEIDRYVAIRSQNGQTYGLWFDSFIYRAELSLARPFPSLPSLPKIAPQNASVDPEPYAADFAFEAHGKKRWRLADRLLVGLHSAARGDDATLRALVRLLMMHEYVHLFHSIGKNTVIEVGKFANCLEYIDYTADTYALLHQLDMRRFEDPGVFEFQPMQAYLIEQIDLAIQSFWTFDVDARAEWQVRRLKRYFNWYWRQVQIENASSKQSVFLLFRRQPLLEIGGLHQFARGRRIFAQLDRFDSSTHLELGVVTEDDKLFRVTDGPNINLRELLVSFQKAEHSKIRQFFRAVYDYAAGMGCNVQPSVIENSPR